MGVETEAAEHAVKFMTDSGTMILRAAGSLSGAALKWLIDFIKETYNEHRQNLDPKIKTINDFYRTKQPVDVVTVKDGDLPVIEKNAKQFGLRYAVVKDDDLNDGKKSIMILHKQQNIWEAMVSRFGISILEHETTQVEPEPERNRPADGPDPADRADRQPDLTTVAGVDEMFEESRKGGKETQNDRETDTDRPTREGPARERSESAGTSTRDGNTVSDGGTETPALDKLGRMKGDGSDRPEDRPRVGDLLGEAGGRAAAKVPQKVIPDKSR